MIKLDEVSQEMLKHRCKDREDEEEITLKWLIDNVWGEDFDREDYLGIVDESHNEISAIHIQSNDVWYWLSFVDFERSGGYQYVIHSESKELLHSGFTAHEPEDEIPAKFLAIRYFLNLREFAEHVILRHGTYNVTGMSDQVFFEGPKPDTSKIYLNDSHTVPESSLIVDVDRILRVPATS